MTAVLKGEPLSATGFFRKMQASYCPVVMQAASSLAEPETPLLRPVLTGLEGAGVRLGTSFLLVCGRQLAAIPATRNTERSKMPKRLMPNLTSLLNYRMLRIKTQFSNNIL